MNEKRMELDQELVREPTPVIDGANPVVTASPGEGGETEEIFVQTEEDVGEPDFDAVRAEYISLD